MLTFTKLTHANITVCFFYSFAFPCLSNIVVTRSETQPVGIDGPRSMEQTCSEAVPECTRNLNPGVCAWIQH